MFEWLDVVNMGHKEDIKARTEAGEFGTPPEQDAINEAWAVILEAEMERLDKGPTYTSITGLWAQQSGKVAYSGRTSEKVTIPENTKILAFKNEVEPGTRQPELSLAFVTYDESLTGHEAMKVFDA